MMSIKMMSITMMSIKIMMSILQEHRALRQSSRRESRHFGVYTKYHLGRATEGEGIDTNELDTSF